MKGAIVNKWVTIILQSCGVLLHIANIYSGMVPAKWQTLVAAVIAFLQGVEGLIAHYYNPDGSPAQVSWSPIRSTK